VALSNINMNFKKCCFIKKFLQLILEWKLSLLRLERRQISPGKNVTKNVFAQLTQILRNSSFISRGYANCTPKKFYKVGPIASKLKVFSLSLMLL
jgi:hypothetical protein